MDNLYFDESIATNLYEYAKDMDYADYEDTKEQEIALINEAISKIHSYASYNDDFSALYGVLLNAFGEV